jgi:hypothetical protein
VFKEYDLKIRKILSAESPDTDWRRVLENHIEMITTIRHERLIHLLVTIFVGTVMAMSSFVTIITGKPYLLLLNFPLLALFMGYIIHYRFLENTTQNWYKLEELIKARF